MADYPREQLPPHDRLADDQDELGWDRDKHGRFADFATGPEGEPETVPYDPADDPFLTGEG
jgi:hypothetical protein